MSGLRNDSLRIITIIIIVFSLISLACGSSTSQQLASAVPPTAMQVQAGDTVPPTVQSKPDQPTATQAKVSSPTPKPEPLEVLAKGMGQDGQSLGYGFMVRNPNTNFAYENSQYQIAFYNAEGTVIDTDFGYLDLILPGQELGVGGTSYLDEGLNAATLEVQIKPGDAVVSDLSSTFTVDKIAYSSTDYSEEVRGVITSPYDKDITSLRVSALMFNDANEIIGGGFTYLNFINASTSTGVRVSVTSYGNVSRAEVYPTLSGLSMLDIGNEIPAEAQSILLSKQGYGQDGSSVGIGLIFSNPNPGHSVESSMYHLTAYAEDGSVLGVSEGYLDILLPDQTLGEADEMYVDDGVSVARLDAQIMSGNFNASESLPYFTADNIAYLPGDYSSQVTGEIVNPYSKDISNLRVCAIAYNDAGEIIGSGSTYLDFVPANGKSAVSIYLTSSGTPASIELYATLSALSDIEE
jgi:hypothetical protein